MTGQAGNDGAHCGLYDSTGKPISVSCASLGSVSYLGNISGNVYLDCDGHTPVPGTDKLLKGVTVTLLNVSSTQTQVAATDVTGHYSFVNLPPGNYNVQVTPPASYQQTYPVGNAQPLSPSCNTSQDFGFADNTPIHLTVPAGVNYGCTPPPANLLTIVSNGVTATDDNGPVPFTVTGVQTTSTGCLVQEVFTIVARHLQPKHPHSPNHIHMDF